MKITSHQSVTSHKLSRLIPAVLSSVLALSACGGGGGDGTTPPGGATPPPDNQPPEITVTGPETVFEGAPIELTVVASDPDGDELTFSLEDQTGAAVPFDSEDEVGGAILRFTAPDVDAMSPMTYTVTASDNDLSTQATIETAIKDLSGQSVVFVEETGSSKNRVATLMRLDGGATEAETVFQSEAGRTIVSVSISPDGRWVIFDQFVPGKPSAGRLPWQIVPLTGGEAVNLTEGLENPAVVIEGSPQWLADSNAIIFMADGRFPGVNEVYAVSLPFTDVAEARQRISGALPDADGEGGAAPTGSVTEFVPAPVGNKVALRGDLEQDDHVEVFVTDLEGDRYRVSGSAPDVDSAYGLPAWSFDASRLAFTGDADNDGAHDLYMTAADTVDNATALSGDLDLTGRVFETPVWSPVANQLLSELEDDPLLPGVPDQLYWFSVDTGETGFSRLVSGDMSRIFEFTWSPTGQHIGLQGEDAETSDARVLYVITLQESGSSERVRLSPLGENLAAGVNLDGRAHTWSPDGAQIIFMSESAGTAIELLLSHANALSTPAVNLSSIDPPRSECGFEKWSSAPRWSSDGQLVVLNAACPDNTGALRAYRTTSSSPEALLYLSLPSDLVAKFAISEDSERFVYEGDRQSEPDCVLWDVTEATAGNPRCIYFNPENPQLFFLEIVERE